MFMHAKGANSHVIFSGFLHKKVHKGHIIVYVQEIMQR